MSEHIVYTGEPQLTVSNIGSASEAAAVAGALLAAENGKLLVRGDVNVLKSLRAGSTTAGIRVEECERASPNTRRHMCQSFVHYTASG